jgi:hypothetical protein
MPRNLTYPDPSRRQNGSITPICISHIVIVCFLPESCTLHRFGTTVSVEIALYANWYLRFRLVLANHPLDTVTLTTCHSSDPLPGSFPGRLEYLRTSVPQRRPSAAECRCVMPTYVHLYMRVGTDLVQLAVHLLQHRGR